LVPRPRQRATLEAGLKLDLYRMARRGIVRPEGIAHSCIQWTNTDTSNVRATASITAHLRYDEGSFRIQASWIDQWIFLQPRPRHFGGRQWFFICPITNRRASVLWMPPGARRFASRHAWPRSAAYASQFLTPYHRAWRGQEKIKYRLIADLDPDAWALPPKPKWMRWATYNRYEAKFDRYEEIMDWDLMLATRRLFKAFGGRF
jgi:hypothetical protein